MRIVKRCEKLLSPPFTKIPIISVDNKTGDVTGYASSADAARALGTRPANIQRAVNGKYRLTSLGKTWYTVDTFGGKLPNNFKVVPI